MQIPDYPGNNRKINDHPKDDIPDKEIKKVVKGKVTTQKKSIGEKFADTFLAEDVDSVKVYFWQDLFVPTVKKTCRGWHFGCSTYAVSRKPRKKDRHTYLLHILRRTDELYPVQQSR